MIQSYPWYIADWRESETRIRLSLAERALYREMLDYCYLEGSLPADHTQLSRITGCSVAEVKRHIVSVECLFHRAGERLTHDKVDEVRAKLATYHEQKRHAGARSGQTRRQRAIERKLNGRSSDVPTEDEPSPAPAPTPAPDIPQTPAAPDGADFDLSPADARVKPKKVRGGKRTREQVIKSLGPERLKWFEALADVHPAGKQDTTRAMDVFDRKVPTRAMAVIVFNAGKQYAIEFAADQALNPSRTPKSLAGWLNDDRFYDAPRAIAVMPKPILSVTDRAKLKAIEEEQRNGLIAKSN